jgi:hypothetical protein
LLRTLGYVAQAQFSDYAPPPQVAASAGEFAERVTEAAGAVEIPIVVGTLANLVTSSLLIVGGALILARKPSALGLMTKTVIASIVVSVYSAALAAWVQYKTQPVMSEMLREASANTPPGTGITPDMMSVVTLAGTAFAALWLLCKLAYYIVALVGLKQPATKAWFAGTGEA